MKINKLSGLLGAEIIDADIRDENQFEDIKRAFVEHSVIVVRKQNITPDDHLEFARRFGPINVNRFFKKLDTHPEVAIVLKEKDQKGAIGEQWHTDHSYDEAPAMGSILHAIEVPPYGGDTVFVSMASVYESLSPSIQNFLKSLNAWHSSRHVFGAVQNKTEAKQSGRIQNADQATQDVLHPMVIKHPLSGRHGIYVNQQFTTKIDGLSDNESRSLLDMIYHQCMLPEYQTRVHWQAGDITMWDNRATWHKAINDYHGHRRYMHRVTVEGCNITAAEQ